MIRFYVLITITTLISSSLSENSIDCDTDDGYYWRDYKLGDPMFSDALPGGLNDLQHTTYIGQTLHNGQLIPARIDIDTNNVTYEWGYIEHHAYINIKVLCSKVPENFEWILTGNRRINGLTDKQFVDGGYEPGIRLLIGRTMLDGVLTMGKVVFTNTQSTLNTTKDGQGTQHGEFYVLVYNKRTRKNPMCDIDLRGGSGGSGGLSTSSPGRTHDKTIVVNFFN